MATKRAPSAPPGRTGPHAISGPESAATGLGPADYKVLANDLDRIGLAEGAGFRSLRPLLRLGAALVVLTVAALALAALLAATGAPVPVPAPAMMLAGAAVGLWLALTIGANDVANSAAPVVGAGALRLLPALALVACAELAGALIAGQPVTDTVSGRIVAIDRIPEAAALRVMLAALTGAAAWVTLATLAGAPVSTTHSIVGAIAGAGVAQAGMQAVEWRVLATIASAWVVAPLVSAALAGGILTLLRWKIHHAGQRDRAARLWLPVLVGATLAIFTGHLGSGPLAAPALPVAAAALAAGLAGALLARRQVDRDIAARSSQKQSLKNLLTVPLILTAALSGFAHGANDVASVAGPLAVLTAGAEILPGSPAPGTPLWVLAIAAGGIAAGSLIFGRRLVRVVGGSITRLNPVRAFCAALGAAATVMGCSALGLPVSTTHCAVAGIFGVGFAREIEDRVRRKSRLLLPPEEAQRRRMVRRSHVWTILVAWAVTLPAAGLIGAALSWMMAGWD